MESWHLPNLSVQIAPDCISEYLNVQNFPGGCPQTPLVSRDFFTPKGRSRAHIANILNYATPGLTNKKRLGTPLQSTGAVKEIFQITRPKNTVTVGHYRLGVIIDSGASMSVIDKKDFDQLVQQNNKITLRKANAKIFTYGAEKPLPLVGAFEATVKSVTCSTAATCCKR